MRILVKMYFILSLMLTEMHLQNISSMILYKLETFCTSPLTLSSVSGRVVKSVTMSCSQMLCFIYWHEKLYFLSPITKTSSTKTSFFLKKGIAFLGQDINNQETDNYKEPVMFSQGVLACSEKNVGSLLLPHINF